MPAEAGVDAMALFASTTVDPNGFKVLSCSRPQDSTTSLGKSTFSVTKCLQGSGEEANYLNIPNLGNFDDFSSVLVVGDLKVERWLGAVITPRSRTTSLTLATIGGKMRFNFVYWDSIIDESRIIEIANRSMNVLSNAIR